MARIVPGANRWPNGGGVNGGAPGGSRVGMSLGSIDTLAPKEDESAAQGPSPSSNPRRARHIPLNSRVVKIQVTTRVFKEGRTYVAHALELDVSSCGGTKGKALKSLKEAVRLFLEEAAKMGSLKQILEEAECNKRS